MPMTPMEMIKYLIKEHGAGRPEVIRLSKRRKIRNQEKQKSGVKRRVCTICITIFYHLISDILQNKFSISTS